MCGINGFISSNYSIEQRTSFVKRMNEQLAHRGPDAEGTWSADEITLGHRRLSIIDLSAESNQPFVSADNRYVLVYNGELYNYLDLKLELQRSAQGAAGQPFFFRTNSDTEVVLAAFLRWGSKCLDYFNGMYAFAIYDRDTKKFFAARDRMGVKPFYYAFGEQGFLFSSEIRSILRSGVRQFSVNKSVIAEYAMFQTVLAPNTIVKEIKVLMPGHFLTFENGKAEVVKYYDLNKIKPISDDLSYEQVCGKVRDLLGASVQRRLVSDVPFGAFLSGGIDSSIVVGMMSSLSTQKVLTFNVSFDESAFSESQYARIIAKKFNTDHHEIKLSPADFLAELPEALTSLDHPGGDGPNTYIVAKATKKAGITMALSGIGGDELFAGYDVFKRMWSLQKKPWLSAVPGVLRKAAGTAIAMKQGTIGGKKIKELLYQEKINLTTAYPLSRSLFTAKELRSIVHEGTGFETISSITQSIPQLENRLLSSVSLLEINTYLQNVLLRDADQMGMAVALEIREPFLDYQLAEFVLGVKDDFKYPHTPKKLLVDSVGDLLPPEIVNRPKMGFTLPWQIWMKNELRSFCETNLLELSERGLVDDQAIPELWKKFLAGDKSVSWSRLWHFVTLNNWLRVNKIENIK